jgi:hypothetical protein
LRADRCSGKRHRANHTASIDDGGPHLIIEAATLLRTVPGPKPDRVRVATSVCCGGHTSGIECLTVHTRELPCP